MSEEKVDQTEEATAEVEETTEPEATEAEVAVAAEDAPAEEQAAAEDAPAEEQAAAGHVPADAPERPASRTEKTANPDRRHPDGVPAIIRRRRPFGRRKVCRFSVDPTLEIDYRDPQLLKYFVTERGKIIPRRISGNSAKHQREMARAIKRARAIGLMPFTVVTS